MTRPVTPQLTADVIIEMPLLENNPIILIERKFEPYGWAIPGGFVDVGETIASAARREALEETTLEVELDILLGIYSNPKRDSRMHTVSAVYIAEATGSPKAADDAANVKAFAINELPEILAFDHGLILKDYLSYLKEGKLAPLRCV